MGASDTAPPLGVIVRIDGHLFECVGIAEGTTVIFRQVGVAPCLACGEVSELSYLTHSNLYETEVKPVETIR